MYFEYFVRCLQALNLKCSDFYFKIITLIQETFVGFVYYDVLIIGWIIWDMYSFIIVEIAFNFAVGNNSKIIQNMFTAFLLKIYLNVPILNECKIRIIYFWKCYDKCNFKWIINELCYEIKITCVIYYSIKIWLRLCISHLLFQ